MRSFQVCAPPSTAGYLVHSNKLKSDLIPQCLLDIHGPLGERKKFFLKVNDCFMIYDKGRNLYTKRTGDQRESHPIMTPEAA